MGLNRIIIDGFTYKEMAVQAAEKAKVAIESDLSITKIDVVVHPGESDEEIVKVYRAAGYEQT